MMHTRILCLWCSESDRQKGTQIRSFCERSQIEVFGVPSADEEQRQRCKPFDREGSRAEEARDWRGAQTDGKLAKGLNTHRNTLLVAV